MEENNLSKHERRLLKHQQKEDLKAAEQEVISRENRSRLIKKLSVFSIIALIVIAAIVGAYSYYNNLSGPYDDFAKCLTAKGAIMYGAIEWCHYTQAQAGMFGKSFKYVNYKNYKDGPDIKITPTWFINGQKYEQVQSFQKLADLTGCTL